MLEMEMKQAELVVDFGKKKKKTKKTQHSSLSLENLRGEHIA